MWEKYTHHILRSVYDLMTIGEDEEPLYSYLVKAQKLQDTYFDYKSSRNSAQEKEMLESIVPSDSDDREQQLKQLTFPFDQVSEGYFLAYFLEAFGGLQKGLYSSRLKKDVSYRIQYIKNLEFLLNAIHSDFKLDLLRHGVDAESLTKNNYEAANNLFWLLFSKLKLERVLYKGKREEEGLRQWALDCVSYYPGISISELQFEDGFNDGVAFCYIYHFFNAETIDLSRVLREHPEENLKQAFDAGWRFCNIPQIIQNHNINKRSSIIYLYMMYEALHDKQRATFGTNQLSRIIRRKLEFEKLKNFYTDRAKTVLEDLRGMELDIKDIKPNHYLNQSQIEEICNQLLYDYKGDKSGLLEDFMKIYSDYFNLTCLTHAENGFRPYEPPGQISLLNLNKVFDSLTPLEREYLKSYHNLKGIHSAVTDMVEDYSQIVTLLKTFTVEASEKLMYLDPGNQLENHQQVHSQIGDILVDFGQNRALLRIVEYLDSYLEKHDILPTPAFDDVLSMWNSSLQQAESLYKNLEQQMNLQIEAEVMKLEYSFLSEGLALSISNSIWLLQAPYIGPDLARVLFSALDNFIQEKSKSIHSLGEFEQKVVGRGQEVDITKDQLLEFLNDLIRLRDLKEDDMQEPLRACEFKDRIEGNAKQITKFIIDLSSFLENITSNPSLAKIEPEELITKNLDKLKLIEKEKNQISIIFNTFISSYSEYSAFYDGGAIKFTDQNIQTMWNKMQEAFKVQKAGLEKLDSQLEKIPTLRLTQQSEIQTLTQILSQYKREYTPKALDLSSLNLLEENVSGRVNDIQQIISRHFTITLPSCLTSKVRKETVFTFSNVMDSFIQFIDNSVKRWNRFTLDIANLVDVNKKRHSNLQKKLSHSIQEATIRIPHLKAIDDVLEMAKTYAHDSIILDQIEFLDEILRESTLEEENDERKLQFITLKNQWETLWELIRTQVRKLIEGEGNVISPDIEFLNEKFKKTLEKLKNKASSLDEEYRHEFRSLPKILKTVSEIHADLHHAKIFYELYLQQIHNLSEDERDKYIVSGFDTFQKWILQIRKEIEKDVIIAFEHEENKAKYIKIATFIFETSLAQLEQLTTISTTFNINNIDKIDQVCKDATETIDELNEKLQILNQIVIQFENYRDRPDVGDKSISFLTNELKILESLVNRIRQSESLMKEKDTCLEDLRVWLKEHIDSILEWIRTVENSIVMIDRISSIDDIFLSKRLLQHHLQESTFVHHQIRDIGVKISCLEKDGKDFIFGEADLKYIKDSWDVLIPRLQQALNTIEKLEENYSSRNTLKSQLQMDIIRIDSFIEILKAKNIERPINFVGRVSINLIETYIEDCIVLQKTIENLPDLSRTQIETTDIHPFLIPIDRDIEELKHDYKQVRNKFEFSLSEMLHKLQNYLKLEKELDILNTDYNRLAHTLLVNISNVDRPLDTSMNAQENNDLFLEFSTTLESVKKIHNNNSTKIIESIPFDILHTKWKKICRISKSNGIKGEINIDNHKRKQELKRLIFESSKQVFTWIDNALKILQQTSNNASGNVFSIQQAQKILEEIKQLNSEEEGIQYGKIIQILSQFIELVLFNDEDFSDVESIVKNIERKWLQWMKESKSMMDQLGHTIEELQILDYQKKNFHNMSVGIIEWITLVTSELGRISTDLNDPTQLRVQTYHLTHWMRQKQSKIEIVRELQDICQNMRVPDNELIKNMQEINFRWNTMEKLASEKQSVLSQINTNLDAAHSLENEILSKHEEIIKWISYERDNLINALRNNSSVIIQDTLENSKLRIKTEAAPILEFLQTQRKFIHKNLLDNHWNTFIFLFNRLKKRADELSIKEQRNKVKLDTFESKLQLYFESLSQLIDAIATIVDFSSKASTKEMGSAIDDMIEVYGSMEGIVSEYVTLLINLDLDNDFLIDFEMTNRFEKFCIECFTKFKDLFKSYTEEYENKMKTQSITETYYSIYQAVSSWIDIQKQVFEALDGEKLQLSSISSRYAFYNDYFSQRQQITSIYHQLSDVWAILASIGVVLEIQVPTPTDLKGIIENLDETIGTQLSRIEDLISQFEYVLSLRLQFIETACNISQFSQDAMFQLLNSPLITPDIFSQVKQQVDSLRKKDRNTTSVLIFLDELTQTILDECILLPSNWDPQLRQIVQILKKNREHFERILTNQEVYLEIFEPIFAELTSSETVIKEMSSALLTYASDSIPKFKSLLEDNRLTRIDRLNQIHKFVSAHNAKTKYLLRLFDVISKVGHTNWMSNNEDHIISDIWKEIISEWKDVSHVLNQCIKSISFLGEGIPTMKDTSDVQLFLEILYLNIWITDSCLDLEVLLNHDLHREDVSDILFDINIFTREMEENQIVLRRVIEVDPESDEILILRNSWEKLQDLFSKSILKLTDHVMIKFHFEHDRGRVLSIHNSLSLFLEHNSNISNPVYLSQEFTFYYVKMIPNHFENNITLRNLFTTREIRALQEDFESMKQPFIDNMSTEDNQEQQLEKMRILINDSLKELSSIAILFSDRDYHMLTEDYDQITKEIQDQMVTLSKYISEHVVPLSMFLQTLDDQYINLHTTILDFMKKFVETLTTQGVFIQETISSVIEQHNLILHISKKYDQKVESIVERLNNLEELLQKYTDEEDITTMISIVSRNVNPNTSFVPKAEISNKFLDKLGVSPDEMQKQFDILQTLRFEIESMAMVLSELCAIHYDKLISISIPCEISIQKNGTDSSLDSIFSKWESIVNTIHAMISNLPLIDLEKSSRFIDVDYKDLKKWFKEAQQFLKNCVENRDNNQFNDLQWTYLGTKMFKIRKDVMDDRYNRFLSILSPNESSELMLTELNEIKEVLEEKLIDLPDEQELLEKIDKSLNFEHQQLRYGQTVEEAVKWQEEFSHDIEQVQELVSRLRSSTTSLENLEAKFSDIEKGKVLLSVYKERLVKLDSLFTSCENIYVDLKEHIYFEELFFTDIEPDSVFDKEDEHNNILDKLKEEISTIEIEYYQKLNQALEFTIKYNELIKWNQQSLGQFNKSITLDSPAMVEYARTRMKEWTFEFDENWRNNHDSIMQTLSMQNHTLVFYFAYSVKYFALYSVNDFKKSWSNMLQSQKSRESHLEKLRIHLNEVEKKYLLPVELVDPIHSTFTHFAHHNTKSSAIGVLHESMLGNYLIALGMDLNDNNSKQKEISFCMTYSSSADQNISFDDIMLYLTKHHLMIARKPEDLIVIFKKLEKTQGIVSWEKLASIIGTALNKEQMQLLYTLIRFNGSSIDYQRLSESMFN